MKLLDFRVDAGRFYAGVASGSDVRVNIDGPIGEVRQWRSKEGPCLTFDGGHLFLRVRDGSLHAGEISGIGCDREAAESVWRQLTGDGAPITHAMCLIHDLPMPSISPGVYGCEKCVAAATLVEVAS